MKKFLSIAIACILAVAAQAQIVSSHSRSITRQSNNADYERLYVSYAPISFSNNHDVEDLKGFKLGYLYGKSISTEYPIFVEYGSNIHYAWSSDSYEKVDITTTMLNINIPVSIAYKYELSQGVAIAPYAGLHLRGNIIGKQKKEHKSGSDKEINFFDKDDMAEETASRVQVGFQIGAGLTYNQLYVGAAYATQFNEYIEGLKTSGVIVSLGYEF